MYFIWKVHNPNQFGSTDFHKNWYALRRTHLIGGRGAALASFPPEERDVALVWRAIPWLRNNCALWKDTYSSQICSTSCDRWYAEPFWGWLKSETQKQEWNHISQRSSYHWPLHFKEPTRVSRYHYLLADYQFSVASHKSMDQSITYTCLVIEFSFFFCLLILYILYHNTPRRASYYISIQNNMKKGARACLTKLGGTFAVLAKMKSCFEDLRSKAFQWGEKGLLSKKRTIKGPVIELLRTFSRYFRNNAKRS